MHIAYYDESGDDGYPDYSSNLFILSSLYLHYSHWNEEYQRIYSFRKELKEKYSIPVKQEIHCKQLILNKNPFRDYGLPNEERIEIIDACCEFIGGLNAKIVNVVIVKPKIKINDYDILDTALKYSVQRIENDLDPQKNPDSKFMIITDPGRVGKMKKTTRRIQRINYIPSKLSPTPIRRDIQSLIEDPLQKDSKESYFIQLADIVTYIVYLYSISKSREKKYPNRLPKEIDGNTIIDWMNLLKPSLNTDASRKDEFGVKFHP
ncbi:MAG: DUF3800 domain-containing protein [Candidatus Krumholzibacteriota bacterium]|nr:DUF3800 domain-containing protein [Candidatus Krumholzibacteriota bacterium]